MQFFLAIISSLGVLKSNPLFPALVPNPNIVLLLSLLRGSLGLLTYSKYLRISSSTPLLFFVTIAVLFSCLLTLCLMVVLNTLPSIIILFWNRLFLVLYVFSLFLHNSKLLISSQRVYLTLSFPSFGPSSP
jgi:hypothetical protein